MPSASASSCLSSGKFAALGIHCAQPARHRSARLAENSHCGILLSLAAHNVLNRTLHCQLKNRHDTKLQHFMSRLTSPVVSPMSPPHQMMPSGTNATLTPHLLQPMHVQGCFSQLIRPPSRPEPHQTLLMLTHHLMGRLCSPPLPQRAACSLGRVLPHTIPSRTRYNLAVQLLLMHIDCSLTGCHLHFNSGCYLSCTVWAAARHCFEQAFVVSHAVILWLSNPWIPLSMCCGHDNMSCRGVGSKLNLHPCSPLLSIVSRSDGTHVLQGDLLRKLLLSQPGSADGGVVGSPPRPAPHGLPAVSSPTHQKAAEPGSSVARPPRLVV